MKGPKLTHSLTSATTIALSLRWIGPLLALAAVGVAVYLWWQQVQVEPALRYKCSLPAFEPVTAECLEPVDVPVDRQFEVIVDPAGAVGRWTTHPVSAGEMLHPTQLSDTPPDRFRFSASGNPLPVGTHGYYLAVPGQVLNAVSPGQLLALSMTDPLGRQLVSIFDKAEILEKDAGGVFLGLSMSQIAAVESLALVQTPEDQPAPQMVWSITQQANTDLPALAVFRMELSAEALRAPGGE